MGVCGVTLLLTLLFFCHVCLFDTIPNVWFLYFLLPRAIVWLQNKRDASIDRNRGPSPRREDAHEYRVGRLKHERVKVPRGNQLLEWAIQVMKYHADRKSILEVRLHSVCTYGEVWSVYRQWDDKVRLFIGCNMVR